MPIIGSHRRSSPVAPPLPVGSSATATIGSTCLPHQEYQAKLAAVTAARAKYCSAPSSPAPTGTATSTATDWH